MRKALELALLVAAVGAGGLARGNGRPPTSNGVWFRPGDAQAVYMATSFGLLVSPDACRFYWFCESDIGYGGTFDPHYAVSPAGTIFATTYGGLRASRDGGCSFATVGVLPATFFDSLAIGPGGEVWAGTADGNTMTNTVYRSRDDAASFTAMDGLPTAVWYRSIATAASDANRVYVAGYQPSGAAPSGHWFRTDDAGTTWRELGLDGVHLAADPELRIAAVSPADPDRLFLTSSDSTDLTDHLYRSLDGGDHLAEVLVTPDFLGDIVVRANGTVIATTRVGVAYESDDGGGTFAMLPGTPQLACLGERSDGLLFGCASNYGGDHMALASSPDARTWTPVVRFEYLTGPDLNCAAESNEAMSCGSEWRGLETQFGVMKSRCASGPGATEPVADAPVAPPPPLHVGGGGGGCCDAGGERDTLPVAFAYVLLCGWRPKRRGSHSRSPTTMTTATSR